MKKTVSIIIVNWNGGDVLKNCVNSILRFCLNDNYEIIIIDNNSSDKSLSFIDSSDTKIRLIRNKENIGFAAANNLGIRYANGDFILLLNSDKLLLDDNITIMIENMSKVTDQVVMMSCKLLNIDKTLQFNCYDLPSIKSYFFEYFFRYRRFNRKYKYETGESIPCISGAYMFIRKNYINIYGLFDERYYFYQEDTDLCKNIYKNGYKINYYANSSVVHLGGISTQSVQSKMLVQMHKNRFLYIKKYYSKRIYLVFKTMTKLSLIVDFAVSFAKILLFKISFNQFIKRIKSYKSIMLLK